MDPSTKARALALDELADRESYRPLLRSAVSRGHLCAVSKVSTSRATSSSLAATPKVTE